MTDARTEPRTESAATRRSSVVTVWFLLMFAGVVAEASASTWSSRAAVESTADGGCGLEFAVVDVAEGVCDDSAPCDARSSHDLPRYWRVGRGGLPAPRAP